MVNFPSGYKPFEFESRDRAYYAEILAERDRWKSLCEDLVDTIENEGPRPWRHHDVHHSQRNQWPLLWSQIDKIIAAVRDQR
jgi:hypothetical protein